MYLYLSSNNLCDVYESGFRPNPGTEAAPTIVVKGLKINSYKHEDSLVVLLELSAAFVTIDHVILLKPIEDLLRFGGTVLSGSLPILLEGLFLFKLIFLNQSILIFHTGSLRGQFLVISHFNRTCSYLDRLFSATIFRLSLMLMTHSNTYQSHLITLAQ